MLNFHTQLTNEKLFQTIFVIILDKLIRIIATVPLIIWIDYCYIKIINFSIIFKRQPWSGLYGKKTIWTCRFVLLFGKTTNRNTVFNIYSFLIEWYMAKILLKKKNVKFVYNISLPNKLVRTITELHTHLSKLYKTCHGISFTSY